MAVGLSGSYASVSIALLTFMRYNRVALFIFVSRKLNPRVFM